MLNAIKPSKKTVILYLLVPVVLFIFTVFVPLVTALRMTVSSSGREVPGRPSLELPTINSCFRMVYSGRLLAIIFIWSATCIVGQIGIAFVLRI